MYKMAEGRPKRAASKVDFKSPELVEEILFDDVTKKEKGNKADSYDVVLASEEPTMKDGVLKNKVHYVGYSNEFDEWVPLSEIINKFPCKGVLQTNLLFYHGLFLVNFCIWSGACSMFVWSQKQAQHNRN